MFYAISHDLNNYNTIIAYTQHFVNNYKSIVYISNQDANGRILFKIVIKSL